jgi:8-oxo-dGTP pyrophosphatase MutT (NUDIX family)
MQLLKEIKDQEYPADESVLKIREAARAVIFDENNLVALLFVSKDNYHKIPGGGVEAGEDILQALVREVKEEAGCEIEVTGEVGEIIEFRSKWNLKQKSFCYLGKVISKGETNFTEGEAYRGFELIWLTLDEAIARLENDKPTDYEGGFIQERDLAFLQKAREIL